MLFRRWILASHDKCSLGKSHRLLSTTSALLSAVSTSTTATPTVEPPPAGGHLPSVSTSVLLRQSRDSALKTPGLIWTDEGSEEVGGRETRKMNMYQAIRDALSISLSKDDTAVVFGEDVNFGGVFRCTMGLAEEFGRERVFNTPLTEQGIIGFGIGLASMGHTAIAEIQFADYIFPAFDQLVNEAAKFRYRSGGQFNCGSMTVRTPTMAVGHGGLYHSQSPEGFFMGASGLKIVIPRSPIQAKGLLLASIRDPNPVIFMEPKVLYRSAVEQVPVDDYTLPLGKAEILQRGDDLTVVTFGTPVFHCETALSMLRDPPEGIAMHIPSSVRGAKVELIDLRSILPWDVETVAESVNRTGRVVFVHEAGRTMGVASEMCAEIQKRCFLKLEAPLKRVTGWDVPHALQFEKMHLPDSIRIIDGIPGIIEYRMRHIIAPPPMQDYQAPLDSDTAPPKPVASRGARACTVCRAAKMKCVGAEDDGAKPCQRCRRSNSECVFEKHRRGRKPGSKLSEASKLLRKIEKSSATPAKIKSMSDVPSMVPSQSSPSPSLPLPPPPPPPPLPPPSPSSSQSFSGVPSSTRYSTMQSSSPPPPQPSSALPVSPQIQSSSTAPPPFPPPAQQQPSAQETMEEDEEDEKDEETMYPAKMVEREGRRHNFFGTVLTNPIPKPSSTPVVPSSSSSGPSSALERIDEHRHRHHGPTPSSSARNVRPSSPGASSSNLQPPSWFSLNSIPPNLAAALRRFPFITSRFLQNPVPIPDPVRADILSLNEVSSLFDMIFLRLNPFVNLFDPALHTPDYVRETCPFLFTVLCMAGCKFFKPEKFRAIQRMAEDLCLRAFQECWKRVEVVQAFMCMTYWREPDDQRTWTFIGYAARMAIELGLNTYCYPTNVPPPGETTDMHRLQRRNRERTYLVLWVHDRSLSMQTGRHWMLPEDDLVRNAAHWYHESTLLPIDTVVAGQTELRRIAASVIDAFYLHRARNGDTVSADVNYDVLLSACNSRLQLWNDDWMTALQKTNGAHFHTSLLTFFKLHVGLFLNSLGLQSSLLVHHSYSSSSPEVHPPVPNLFALNACYSTAAETLQLVARDFSKVEMLRYGQDSITVMTAYSAVFLLKLLRNVVQASSLSLGDNSLERVYELINATADAYQACAKSTSANSALENESRLPVDSGSGENMETDPSFSAGGATTLNYSNSKNGECASNNSENYTNSTNAKSTNVKATTPPSTMIFSSVEYHGRFLRTLVLKDKASRARATERERRRATGASFNGSNKTKHSPTYGGVARINTSGLPNLASSSSSSSAQIGGGNSNTLAVSPTTSAAATALLGGSFSGSNTKGLNGLANAAASSALTSGSASSPRNAGEIIIPSSSSTTTSGSGGGTPTGNLYHVSVPGSSSLTDGNSSPYIVPSSSTSHHHQRSQQLMGSHSHHITTQPSNARHIPKSHNNGNSGVPHLHRASFSQVQTPQHSGSATRSQSHLQRVDEVQYTGSMQQQYHTTIPNHSLPTWHFPASPHLPTHPLISPEDEFGPLDLDNAVSGTTGIASSGTYNQPLGSMNNSTNTANGHVMNSLTDDDGASPQVGGEGCNGDESTIEGLPSGASVADVAYWYFMHSEMGYGNGGINPLASVGAGMGNGNGGFVGVTGQSMGMNMTGAMNGGNGGMGLTNINNGIGNSGINIGMSAMNTVPGLAVPNVSHAGLSGMGVRLAAGNNNASDSGGAGVNGTERSGTGATMSSSSGANPKHRTSSNNASGGYPQHVIHHTHPQNHSSSHHGGHGHNHSSTAHSMPSPYHTHGQSHGHHVMQNG